MCHWEQRTGGGNPKLVGMSENHSVETGVPPKTGFGGQVATPRPDSVLSASTLLVASNGHKLSVCMLTSVISLEQMTHSEFQLSPLPTPSSPAAVRFRVVWHSSTDWSGSSCKLTAKQCINTVDNAVRANRCSARLEQVAIQRHSVTVTRHLQASAEDTSFRCFPYLTHLYWTCAAQFFL